MFLRSTAERMLAVAYGMTYDAIVTGFRPYEALLDEVVALIERSAPSVSSRRSTRILDIACGTGTVAARLWREGYSVVGVDAIEHLVSVARSKESPEAGPHLTFRHLDLARDALPGAGTFDALVSMHTLYWHADPDRLLGACRRALKPGGYGVFLTYSRPARVWRTFHEVRAREGVRAAIRALRWLVPTAVFELVRRTDERYLCQQEFHAALARAGFQVVEARRTFLAGISLLALARADPG